MHLPHLIQDLGLILVAAAIVTILFKRLKQPVVLGYLIAGFLVGPNFPWIPSVQETASVMIWAEIGVIFMLFGLGLEFSFKKLGTVGKSAAISALSTVAFMLGLGFFVGQILDWPRMDSLFLGAILSISSTTIIVKAFDELSLKGKNFVSLVLGILIVEDLIAVLLLVLLSSLAVSQSLSGTELIYTSSKFVFFLVLWFVLGIYLLPSFLNKFKKDLSDETILIISLGLCLMMVIIATHVGFSAALGAFVMGSLFAETHEGHRIEKLILPVKNLFSAIFFVSVGMLIDPKIIINNIEIISLITFTVVFGQMLSSGFGALLSGKNIRTSVQTGMCLNQIGEFSFIIATLGVQLNVISEKIYPMTIAVSAVTTFFTPYMIRSSEPVSKWIEKKLPNRIKKALVRYESAMTTSTDRGIIMVLWHTYGIKIFVNGIIIIALTLASKRFLLPNIPDFIATNIPGSINFWVCGFTLILSAPFLWAIVLGQEKNAHKEDSKYFALLKKLQIGIILGRFLIGCIFSGIIVGTFTSLTAVSGFLLLGLAGTGIFFSRFAEPLYKKIEGRFMSNLSARERAEIERQVKKDPGLAPWNLVLSEFTLNPESKIAGKSLQASKIKETSGVTITLIERGQRRIVAPLGSEILMPYDVLYLIGTDKQIEKAKKIIEFEPDIIEDSIGNEAYGLTCLKLVESDPFISKSIRESGLRELVKGLIVGLEREGQRIPSPDPSIKLRADDLVWIVGDLSLVKGLRKNITSTGSPLKS